MFNFVSFVQPVVFLCTLSANVALMGGFDANLRVLECHTAIKQLIWPQFIVMFRSRFSDAFPKSLAHFGPQELERDIIESIPGGRVEHFLCAVLGLLLNRKQDVK